MLLLGWIYKWKVVVDPFHIIYTFCVLWQYLHIPISQHPAPKKSLEMEKHVTHNFLLSPSSQLQWQCTPILLSMYLDNIYCFLERRILINRCFTLAKNMNVTFYLFLIFSSLSHFPLRLFLALFGPILHLIWNLMIHMWDQEITRLCLHIISSHWHLIQSRELEGYNWWRIIK